MASQGVLKGTASSIIALRNGAVYPHKRGEKDKKIHVSRKHAVQVPAPSDFGMNCRRPLLVGHVFKDSILSQTAVNTSTLADVDKW